MTRRARVALLAITALVLAPGIVVGHSMPNDRPTVGETMSGPYERAPLVAVPVKFPVPVVPRGLPHTTTILTGAAVAAFGVRRHPMRGLAFRLGDVGDRWRALLFGAPPALL